MKVQSRFDKNKIGELVCDGAYKYVSNFVVEINGERVAEYNSLQAVAMDWKDYEEPKEIWYIDWQGGVRSASSDNDWSKEKSIGNSFPNKWEAEAEVERLKAWKRLKDGGITFKSWTINQTGTIDCFATWGDNIPPSIKDPTLLDDLNLLFCTEEVKNE